MGEKNRMKFVSSCQQFNVQNGVICHNRSQFTTLAVTAVLGATGLTGSHCLHGIIEFGLLILDVISTTAIVASESRFDHWWTLKYRR